MNEWTFWQTFAGWGAGVLTAFVLSACFTVVFLIAVADRQEVEQ
jgi:hypothetical protein